MVLFRYGGREGAPQVLEDHGDVVVVRTRRHGARHDLSPLSRRSRSVSSKLQPLFGFPPAGVGVYRAPEDSSEEIATALDEDPEVEFAGRGLRDEFGAPVVYTENLFVKFHDGLPRERCDELLRQHRLSVKRPLGYGGNAFFVEPSERGRARGVLTRRGAPRTRRRSSVPP